MQVDIKQINPTSKEIDLTVEAERVEQAYQKYLVQAARSIEIPGFRKGKAPLSMVEKLHSERIRDYFEKDFKDEIFSEAVSENEIRFLLYPEVKTLEWERGSEMKVKFEIEHEPEVEIKQTEGLQIPFRPIPLESEVEKFIKKLAEEHSTVQDAEVAEARDMVEAELTFAQGDQEHKFTVNPFAGDELPQRSLKELLGVRTGDTVEAQLNGSQIKLLARDTKLAVEDETIYPCQLMVNSILRYSQPALDDEFAKDMDFADLAEMRTKIGEDMRLSLEHRNLEGENRAIIHKLYQNNPFPLPPRTLRYIVSEEMQKTDPKYHEILYQYYIQNIAQEMTTLYIMKALRKMMEVKVTDEMLDQFIEHMAILEDKSVGAYSETNAEAIQEEDFQIAARDYFIMRKIAASGEFTEPVEEPSEPDENQAPEPAEIIETKEEKA